MTNKSEPKQLFITGIVLTTIFMGSSFPTGKYLISSDLAPPFFIGGWRFIIAGVLMLAWIFLLQDWRSTIPTSKGNTMKGIILVTAIGLLQTTGTMGFLNLAMAKELSSSVSSIILFTNPLWLSILAHFLLHEKLTRWKIFSLILGFMGVIICLGIDKSATGIGAWIALLGSFCWAVNTVITKLVPFDQGPWIFTGWQLLIGGLGMLIISFLRHETYHLTQLSFVGWLCFIWLILPASVGSFGLWFFSLKRGKATIASSFLFLVPVFSTFFSIVGLHDKFTFDLIIGGLFVIISLVLINKNDWR
ncbi:Uncharacterized inner membrane transporter yiJE [Streptococcus criceti]|uniref:Membrane protein n=1 Tax=Streptococcus criceti HS-6 TaxID=873449 RepID=G5JT13_STRCG|nr:DMT family transporter [Streptococcus criceti]EHI74604.1 putative membrane protein [Streptococcus criceti HS-6]SUN43530.1 Uncharacterized inner membrane transporter yiJE [Streptococcus criceti]